MHRRSREASDASLPPRLENIPFRLPPRRVDSTFRHPSSARVSGSQFGGRLPTPRPGPTQHRNPPSDPHLHPVSEDWEKSFGVSASRGSNPSEKDPRNTQSILGTHDLLRLRSPYEGSAEDFGEWMVSGEGVRSSVRLPILLLCLRSQRTGAPPKKSDWRLRTEENCQAQPERRAVRAPVHVTNTPRYTRAEGMQDEGLLLLGGHHPQIWDGNETRETNPIVRSQANSLSRAEESGKSIRGWPRCSSSGSGWLRIISSSSEAPLQRSSVNPEGEDGHKEGIDE